MVKLYKVARYLLMSILCFGIISSLISLSVWLDMRVHARHVVYIIFIAMLLVAIFIKKKYSWTVPIMEAIFLVFMALGKFTRISYELREAFYIPMAIGDFKLLLIAILVILNIIIIFYYQNYRKSYGVKVN